MGKDLLTAEAVTKLLRSKDTSITEIVNTANSLLNNTLDIYLPGKEVFVLNLLCDRLNDKSNGKFGKWKFNKDVWNLLLLVWSKLNHQKVDRQRVIQRLKIIEIIILVLQQNNDNEVFSSLFEFLGIMFQESYIIADENSATQLLKCFVEHMDVLQASDSIVSWTELVRDIYTRACLKISLEGSKKFYNKFFEDCCFPLIEYLAISEGLSVSPILKELLIQGVFNADSTKYYQSSLERELKKKDIKEVSVIYLYTLTVQLFSAKHMEICEGVYSIMASKCPDLAEKLLSILASCRKTISKPFIELIYKVEVADKPFKQLNWDMVKHIFAIDSELAISESRFLFKTYKSEFQLDDKVVPVAEVIVDGFARNRELLDFFTKVWPKAIKRDEIWESDEFIHTVSQHVKTFSGKQLIDVIESSFYADKGSQRAIFTAITKGLTSSSANLIDAVKQTLLDRSNYFNATENFWCIRYYLLCLYGTDFTIAEQNMKQNIDLYYHFSIFRLLELQVIKEYSKSDQKYFIACIEGEKEMISPIFKRWLVIFNKFFDSDLLIKLILLGYPDIEFDDVFFEQPKLTTSLIRFITENLPARMDLIASIPIVCFNKAFKKELLNGLFVLFVSNPTKETLENIQYLLGQPTYLSILETNFDNMLKLLTVSTEESKLIAYNVIEIVWKNNVRQIKNEENQKYVNDAISKLNSYLDSMSQQIILPELEAILIILTNTKEVGLFENTEKGLNKLNEKFTNYCINTLNNCNTQNFITVRWLLQALVMLPPKSLSFENVISCTKRLDPNILKDNSIQSTLFQLICKTIDFNYKSLVYVLSLFVSLLSGRNTELYTVLKSLFQKFSKHSQLYFEVFDFFTRSIDAVPVEFNLSFAQIASIFLSTVPKDADAHRYNSKCFTFYVNASQSGNECVAMQILTSLKDLLTNQSWIFKQNLLEITLVIVKTGLQKLNSFANQEQIYILSTQIVSHILLYHRFKIATRHHLVLNVMSSLLKYLADGTSKLSSNTEAASAYARLLSNLCEPSERVGDKMSHLTTSASYFKKLLRKHLSVLLSNYIYFNLKYTFTRTVNDAIMPGIYSMFTVLSQNELRVVNDSLDYGGKAFYKTLYNDYKDHGKWKDQ